MLLTPWHCAVGRAPTSDPKANGECIPAIVVPSTHALGMRQHSRAALRLLNG